jgi:DNA-binding transcriptional ArsR family regulator
MIKERTKSKAGKQKTEKDSGVFKKASQVLRAFNHPLRQKILQSIDKSGELVVSEIYGKHKIEQSVASAHLAILRKAGFVNTRREGHFIYYSVNHPRIAQVEKAATSML